MQTTTLDPESHSPDESRTTDHICTGMTFLKDDTQYRRISDMDDLRYRRREEYPVHKEEHPSKGPILHHNVNHKTTRTNRKRNQLAKKSRVKNRHK